MNAVDVLSRLSALGVEVTPRPNGKLWLEPASVIPPDLGDLVRTHKPAILTLLQGTDVAVPRIEAQSRLLNRLRAGITWLTAAHESLCRMEDNLALAGEQYERLRVKFLAALDAWDGMDKMVRELYGFKGCVTGAGQRCPDSAPVGCRYCCVRHRPH